MMYYPNKLAGCFLLVASFVFFSNCQKDDDAEEINRATYIATYSVAETCDMANDMYEIVITESNTSDNGILINNLFDWGEAITATVDNDILTIPSQTPTGLLEFSGSGILIEDQLTIDFLVTFAADVDTCVAICTKK